VANLQLVRAADRRREVALRFALLALAAAASWVPAFQASRVDPHTAMASA